MSEELFDEDEDGSSVDSEPGAALRLSSTAWATLLTQVPGKTLPKGYFLSRTATGFTLSTSQHKASMATMPALTKAQTMTDFSLKTNPNRGRRLSKRFDVPDFHTPTSVTGRGKRASLPAVVARPIKADAARAPVLQRRRSYATDFHSPLLSSQVEDVQSALRRSSSVAADGPKQRMWEVHAEGPPQSPSKTMRSNGSAAKLPALAAPKPRVRKAKLQTDDAGPGEQEEPAKLQLSNILRNVHEREEQKSLDESAALDFSAGNPEASRSADAQDEGDASRAQQEPPSKEPGIKYALTIVEAMSRFEGEYLLEQQRMQIAFERFSLHDGEVSRDHLHPMLVQMGFLTSTPNQAKQLASEMFKFAQMDFVDTADFVAQFALKERHAVKASAAAFAAQEPSARSIEGVHSFLQAAGVFLDDSGVERALESGCPGMNIRDLEERDLLRTLAACKVNEGFTAEECAEAKSIFQNLYEEYGVTRRGWGDQAIRVSALPVGMTMFFSIYAMRHFPELMKRLSPETDRTQGVCFYEFLVWLRRLRDMDMKEQWQLFDQVDEAHTGKIGVAGAVKVAEFLRFTLLGDVVEEILEEIQVTSDDAMDFGTLARFMRAVQECHGFARDERDEFIADFNKFDTEGVGDLSTSQVLDLLRYMGLTVRVDEVYALIDEVDFNKNGTMDPDEFMMLMRFVREKEMALARKAFNKLTGRQPNLPVDQLEYALSVVFEKQPQQEVLDELKAQITGPLHFDAFWKLACNCRTRMTLLSRQRAGFSDEVFHEIETVFNGVGGVPRKFLGMGELIWMLSESQFPVNTVEGRKDLLRRLEIARRDALDGGVSEEELGPEDGEQVGFFTCVHLIRGYVREVESAAVVRENEVLSITRFTSDEAAEFRQVFQQIAMSQRDRTRRKRLGGLLDQLTTLPVIREQDMMKMLRSLGMRVSLNQLLELNGKIREAQEATKSGEGSSEGSVDFVCFLQVIRWMLDTNYAGLNGAAERRASEAIVAPPTKKGSGHFGMAGRMSRASPGRVSGRVHSRHLQIQA